ncbi:hypothetical protein [Primorskyibacter sp. S87]|uniref:hypothetical protein n=1 Tax=Primorskyibacter sp. S87 TaxID=3415126 RepID=UPI003C7B44BF
MAQADIIQSDIAQVSGLLREKLGSNGVTLAAALKKARHRLPRRIYRQGQKLAKAEAVAGHPKLRLTVDTPGLHKAAREVSAHLETIDLADRRKGWWLGMLGGMAFNILAFIAVLLIVLRWRGFI